MQSIMVAIADRSRESRVSCFESLQSDRDIRIVGEATSRTEVMELALALRPSVIVCGMSLAADFGHWLLKTLHRECPDTRMLVVTETILPHDHMAKVLAFGSPGFVARSVMRSDLRCAIRGIARGEAWLPRKALGIFAEHALR